MCTLKYSLYICIVVNSYKYIYRILVLCDMANIQYHLYHKFKIHQMS